MADIPNPNLGGINKAYGDDKRYHEVYISNALEGHETLEVGTLSFKVLLHELGTRFSVRL